MEKKPMSWDDIPSLGLQMEDSQQIGEDNSENRRHDRIDSAEVRALLHKDVPAIRAKVATVKGLFDGKVEDMSQSGIRIFVPHLLRKDEAVKVGFVINSRKIVSKAVVRWVSNVGSAGSIGGLEFVGLDKSDVDFIVSLGRASSLNNVGKVKKERADFVNRMVED